MKIECVKMRKLKLSVYSRNTVHACVRVTTTLSRLRILLTVINIYIYNIENIDRTSLSYRIVFQVVKLIFQGIMLIPPEGCSQLACRLMQECWKTDPKDRIKFPEILEILETPQGKSIKTIHQSTLPRPPQGPVAIRSPDVLDPDGYLLPAPAKPHEYLQTLPALCD